MRSLTEPRSSRLLDGTAKQAEFLLATCKKVLLTKNALRRRWSPHKWFQELSSRGYLERKTNRKRPRLVEMQPNHSKTKRLGRWTYCNRGSLGQASPTNVEKHDCLNHQLKKDGLGKTRHTSHAGIILFLPWGTVTLVFSTNRGVESLWDEGRYIYKELQWNSKN